jgi:recombinational DNA repair protein RecR
MLTKEDLLPYFQKVLTTIDEIIKDTNEEDLEKVLVEFKSNKLHERLIVRILKNRIKRRFTKRELVNLIKELDECKFCNHYKIRNSCDGCVLVDRKNKILDKLNKDNKKGSNQEPAWLKDFYVRHKDIKCSTEEERIQVVDELASELERRDLK